MVTEDYWLDRLPAVPFDGRIAKAIHQTMSRRQIGPVLEAQRAKLIALNPDCSYHFHDADDRAAFIAARYGQDVLDLYHAIDPAYAPARADLFRYLLIYAQGGIYLDIKSFCDRPFFSGIAQDDAFILAQWDNGPTGAYPRFGLHAELAAIPGGEFQQWHVIAARGHPSLRRVVAKVLARIASYRVWRSGVGRIGVLRTTGPIPYTLAIWDGIDRHPHRRLANQAEIGLQYSAVDGYDHKQTVGVHYSQRTTPVVTPSLWERPIAGLYAFLKQRQNAKIAPDQL